MTDLIFLFLTLLLFAASIGFLNGLDRLLRG